MDKFDKYITEVVPHNPEKAEENKEKNDFSTGEFANEDGKDGDPINE